MDASTRNTLRNTVTSCRKILETAVAELLEGRFGIDRKGAITPDERMEHLAVDDRQFREDLITHLEHIQAGGYSKKQAAEQLVREVAFTHLNRLCAHKILETRGYIRESVSRGILSNGFLRFCADYPEEERLYSSGKQDEAYRHYLGWLGATLNEEIGVLFSPTDPANRLFPPQRTIDAVMEELNAGELAEIWESDETVGWIYQYFTPKELRDKARNESTAPRNSYELAFRNQFFTPRYVVQFLTDNSLGRTWYEMHEGETDLAEACEYLVRFPDEVFLGDSSEEVHPLQAFANGDTEFPSPWDLAVSGRRFDQAHDIRVPVWENAVSALDIGEEFDFTGWKTQDLLDCLSALGRANRFNDSWEDHCPATTALAEEIEHRIKEGMDSDASQETLLKSPQLVSFRAKKDPREIRILDPACGSGHFLLYCFDLLETIYREAWEDEQAPVWSVSGKTLHQDYPNRNAFLAAIPGMILRHNLHGIDIDLRATQIASLAMWLRAQRSFHNIGLNQEQRPEITKANIVCAEPMPGEEDMLKEFVQSLYPPLLGALVREIFNKMKLAGEAGSLLKIEEDIKSIIAEAKQQWLTRPKDEQTTLFPAEKKQEWQTGLYSFTGITDASFWDLAEQKVLDALHTYALKVSNGVGYRRKLFSEDAERGFAFIELCQKQYDIVLMNPPFGEVSIASRDYLYKSYQSASQDIFSAFIERATNLIDKGTIGTITNRLAFSRELLRDWREQYLLSNNWSLTVAVDLGYGVLDTAMVEAAAYIISNVSSGDRIKIINSLSIQDKEKTTISSIKSLININIHNKNLFKLIPNSIIAYWCSPKWLTLFQKFPRAKKYGIVAKKGLETGDDQKLLRLRWEIDPSQFQPFTKWTNYAKGGPYQPYFPDIHLVFNWDNLNHARRTSNSELYGKGGITYTGRTTSSFASRILPSECIFSPAGPGIFSFDSRKDLGLMCLLNSPTAGYFIELMVGGGDISEKGGAARYFAPTYIEEIPVPKDFKNLIETLSSRGLKLFQNLYEINVDETNPYFIGYKNFENTLTITIEEFYNKTEEKHIQSLDEVRRIEKIVHQFYSHKDIEINDEKSLFGRPLPEGYEMDDEKRRVIINSITTGKIDFNEINSKNILLKSSNRMLTRLSFSINPLYERLSYLLELNPIIIRNVRNDEKILPHDFITRTSFSIISYFVGFIFGRWDIRYATGEKEPPELPDPFAPLPACSPGMLQGEDGLPLEPHEIPEGYPLAVDADGILVDDEGHPDDIIARIRDVLTIIWGDRADAIEKEACEILGMKSLRDFFRKPTAGGFWDDHVKRYSKSRRKAPIYWLLQSAKKNYGIWIYYPRMDKDTLYKALRYAKDKLAMEERRLEDMKGELSQLGTGGAAVKRLEKEIDGQEAFISELHDFVEKLDRVANLDLIPEHDDGVVLTIAPLHELVPWKEPKKYWDELIEGKYEWSSIGKQLAEKGIAKRN